MARPYLGGSSGAVKRITESQTLSIADSGKLFVCANAALDITLPVASEAKGWTGTFVLAANATNIIDIIGSPSDKMYGTVIAENGTAIDAADKVYFAANAAIVGDRIEVISDGTNWQCLGFAIDDAHIGSTG